MIKRVFLSLLVVPALFIAGCSGEAANNAPNFTLENLNDSSVSLNQFQGRSLIINFWQLGCPPCIAELPHFQSVYTDGNTVAILTIAIGNSRETLETFMTENGYSFPVLVDSNASVASAYNIRYTPTTVFIDKTGKVVDTKVGAFSSKSDLEQALSKLS